MYRGLVATAISHRWLTLGLVVVMFVLAVIGFGSVKSGFFPDSSTPIFFVDVWEPEGADIRTTRDDTLRASAYIREQPGVMQTSSVIGGPHQRFYPGVRCQGPPAPMPRSSCALKPGSRFRPSSPRPVHSAAGDALDGPHYQTHAHRPRA